MPSKQKTFASEVEEVIGKRSVRGRDYYLIKWKDWSQRTWKPIHNLKCKQLIADFEKRRKLLTKRRQPSSTGRNGSASYSKAVKTTARKRGRPAKAKATEPLLEKTKSEPLVGSELGLNPNRITGTTETGGESVFEIKPKDLSEADLPVPVKTDNVLCPDIDKHSISVSVDENAAKTTESKDLPNV